jgi:hypothetical protein
MTTSRGRECDDRLVTFQGSDFLDGGDGTDRCIPGGDPGDSVVNCEL